MMMYRDNIVAKTDQSFGENNSFKTGNEYIVGNNNITFYT